MPRCCPPSWATACPAATWSRRAQPVCSPWCRARWRCRAAAPAWSACSLSTAPAIRASASFPSGGRRRGPSRSMTCGTTSASTPGPVSRPSPPPATPRASTGWTAGRSMSSRPAATSSILRPSNPASSTVSPSPSRCSIPRARSRVASTRTRASSQSPSTRCAVCPNSRPASPPAGRPIPPTDSPPCWSPRPSGRASSAAGPRSTFSSWRRLTSAPAQV